MVGVLQEDLPLLANHKEMLSWCLYKILKKLSPSSHTKFFSCCCKYMLAYQKIVEEADGESTATA
jgi:hypothetical protein